MNNKTLIDNIENEMWIQQQNSNYNYDSGTTWRIKSAIKKAIENHGKGVELLREVNNIWCPENSIEEDVYNKIHNYLKENKYE